MLLLVALVALAVPAPRAAAASPADWRAEVDALVEAAMEANAVPGVAVAVVRGSDVLHVRGYGTAGGDRGVSPDTPFLAASLSKSFTATAVLQLADEGRVELDAPVRRYLPGFTTADADRSGRITVRQLLNHTSGMADTGFAERTLPQPDSVPERVASLRAARLVSDPGEEFHYFNPNYAVLARIVEVVSGRPFDEYLSTRVLDPLGMTATTSVVTTGQLDERAPDRARGHVVAFGRAFGHDEPAGYLAGSGGVVTSASDMANLLRMQLDEGLFEGRRLLSAEAVALLHTPASGSDYAMGWVAREGEPDWLEHTGVLTTAYAEQVLVPATGVGVVVLTNSNHALSGMAGLAHRIASTVQGGQLQGGGPGLRVIGYSLLAVTVLAAGLRSWRLARIRRWRPGNRRSRRRLPRWTRWPLWSVWTLWMLAPVAVLAALPRLTTAFSDRVFGYRQLFWAMPDVFVALAVAALTGVSLLVARGVVLLRMRRGSRS
ncbi:penicillin-binding protein, beta-lactamase class C [Saccharomonospora marina XMU15]|uniref:Penicillin-binding protein, beta-lactamase class C n=1 Tax=Saccharomonospora marina XMU15 TaxID=882083 RepID=H5X880_9PSEU|nr:penicillin-binding protein, beta-lactamase class C [Saccharomonospora marina XMU15]